MNDANIDALRNAIGDSVVDDDVVTASQIGRLAATLDVSHPAPKSGDPVPHGWHGVFFPPLSALSILGADGMPTGGGHGPNLPIPQSRVTTRRSRYQAALQIGDQITKTTAIAAVLTDDTADETNATITIRETISTPRGVAVVDELDRVIGTGGAPQAGPQVPENPEATTWKRAFEANPVMMFRLSAIRFNSHRIHYDRPYTTEVEGLPGLVVPHTLISALMIEMIRAEFPSQQLARFDYRVDGRIYDLGPFTIFGEQDGNRAILWAVDYDGKIGTVAEAEFVA